MQQLKTSDDEISNIRHSPTSTHSTTHVGILALTTQFTSGNSFSNVGVLPTTSLPTGTSSIGAPGVVGGVKAGLRIDGGTFPSPSASDSLRDVGDSVGGACTGGRI